VFLLIGVTVPASIYNYYNYNEAEYGNHTTVKTTLTVQERNILSLYHFRFIISAVEIQRMYCSDTHFQKGRMQYLCSAPTLHPPSDMEQSLCVKNISVEHC